MELEVKLQVFEGPLDLLLHLIEKNKVDIYDIPIVEITEQYLDYVSKMPKDDLDLASEFLYIMTFLHKPACRAVPQPHTCIPYTQSAFQQVLLLDQSLHHSHQLL